LKGILSGAIPEGDTGGEVQAKATGTEAEVQEDLVEEAKAGTKDQEARRVSADVVIVEAAEDDLAEEDKNNKFRI